MSDVLFVAKPPRELRQIEVVDIHILVKATRPVLLPYTKEKNETRQS
jgi:hypothetical protein